MMMGEQTNNININININNDNNTENENKIKPIWSILGLTQSEI